MALRWGIPDVFAWLRSLPSDSFLNQWMAFDRIEPIGEEWQQTSMLASQVVMESYAKAGLDPPKWEDFMPPRYMPEPKIKIEAKPPEEVRKATMKSMLSSLGFKKVTNGGSKNDNPG